MSIFLFVYTYPYIFFVFANSSKCLNDEHNDHKNSYSNFDFEKVSYINETNFEENTDDTDLPLKMLRLLNMENKQTLPHQEIIEVINLRANDDKNEVKIITSLDPSTKKEIIALIHDYVDIFTWSYQDMLGLNIEIVEHKLPMKPKCRPVQQKLKRMKAEMLLKIKEVVKKQFDAGFLEVAKYLEWVANIVSVPKKDGKVRMCVDYKDLNQASLKENFSPPHINTLVDNTTKNSMFSFMDSFFKYNQIRMALEDREKTTFVTM